MTQDTGTALPPGNARAPAARSWADRAGRRLARWLRSEVFLPTAGGHVGWRKAALAVLAVAAGTAVSLSRTAGPGGSIDTIWIEDAKDLLSQALNNPFWQPFGSSISGYYQEPARLITAIAVQFPVGWAPGVMAAGAAAQYAAYGLVAYIASGPHLRSPWLRLLIAAPACALPLAYTQVNNDLVTVQFAGLYGAFWAVLWVPGTRAGRVLAPVVMLSVAATAALAIVFAPLVAARLIADRSRTAYCLAACWLGGVLLQFSRTMLGLSHHQQYGYNGPWWVLEKYVTVVAPRALFGERSLGGPGANPQGHYAPLHVTSAPAHVALIVCAWAVVAAAVILAATGRTAANWPLALVAGLYSIGTFADAMLINTPVVQPRYVIAPALLLYTVLAALLRPRGTVARRDERASHDGRPRPRLRTALGWLPAAGLAALLVVAITLNFRVVNGRTSSPPWSGVVAAARAACQLPGVTSYIYTHEWWQVQIPCSRVR